MATQQSNDASSGLSLAVTALFAASPPEFREAVVTRALRSREQAPRDAVRALDSAIRGSLRIPEYRNPDMAPPHVLADAVVKGMFYSERLAGAALRVWAESHQQLQQVVADHLAVAEIPALYPDLPDNGFRDFWDDDSWEQQLDWIADLSSDWDENDLALMLCYVSGKTIIPPDAGDEEWDDADNYREDASVAEPPPPLATVAVPVEPEPAPVAAPPPPAAAAIPAEPEAMPAVAPPVPVVIETAAELTDTDLLSRCIAWLELLPAAAPEWEAAVPAFVAAINKIYEDNLSHKERFAGLRQTLTEIAAEFAPELEFLEQDSATWSAERISDLASVNRMLETAAELKSLLADYREVHRPAASLSEELPRRERQAVLERQLLGNLSQMAQQMAGDRGGAARSESAATANPAEALGTPDPTDQPDPDPDDPALPGDQGELIYEPVDDEALPGEGAAPTAERDGTAPATRPARPRRRPVNRANRDG